MSTARTRAVFTTLMLALLTPAYASDTELFLPEGKIEKSFETLAKKLQNFAEKNLQDTTLTNFKFEAVKVDRASGKTGVSLSTADRGTHILVTINYDQRAVQNPFEFAKAILPFFGALNSTHFGQPETHISTRGIEVIEMLENAKLGSLSAQAALAKIRSSMIKNLDPQSPGFRALVGNLSAKKLNLADKFIRSETNLAEEETKELEQQAKEISQKRQKYYEEWKKSSGSLEKAESMKQKLDDLIRKNDRTGVRKLIELYLPWPIMEPVEARSWRLWLEAIEKPDPEKSTLVFRGLDSKNDVLLEQTHGDGRPGLMSTLLTKNQGNYTRRLRSLSTKRIINGKDSYTNANYVSIARQFLSHARDPIGSAFLSFSTSLAVAGNFVHNYPGSNRRTGIIVARIDARRLVGNFMSQYISEREVLVPLVVFPDEIVAFVETTQASKMNMKPVELTQQILKQFQIPTYSPEEVSNIWKEHGWMYIKNNFISEAAATCGRVFSK